KLSPCNACQPRWRSDTMTDIAYCFLMPVFTRFVRIAFIGTGIFLFFRSESPDDINDYFMDGFGPLGDMEIWLQAAIVFLVSDFILYWTHRLFHKPSLWNYHAIHHSSPHVDWPSTYRFHPINVWLTFTLVDSAMMLVGFSPAAVAAIASFNMIYSAMV